MEPYQEKHLSYVAWWTDKVKDVSWEEAFKRYSYYIQYRSTPFAFDFKHAFDEKGEPCLVKQQWGLLVVMKLSFKLKMALIYEELTVFFMYLIKL